MTIRSSAVVRPGDAGYDEARAAWNRNVRQQPAAVFVAEQAADVRAAVRAARSADLGIGVQATGHGVGRPCDGGVLVDTSRMRRVSIDAANRTARVEAGALWNDVIPAAYRAGLATLAGSAPHVGVVGYTMGGGFGWLGRRFGLNASGVTGAEVVTADGETVRCSAEQNADLLWAIKGGGGNFGIVTALEFRLHPLTTVFGGAVYYPIEAAREVLGRYAEWTTDLPDEVTTAVAFLCLPPLPTVPEPLRATPVIAIRGCHSGDPATPLFAPMRSGPGDPILDTFGALPVTAMDTISGDPIDPIGIVQRADLLAELTPDAIDTLVDVAGTVSPLTIVELRQLGGALTRIPDLSPMGSGRARFSLNAIGATATPESVERGTAALARLAAAIAPFGTGETCLNYLEPDPAPDRIRAAYRPDDWDRLVALKDRFDPANRFRFNRNIPPSTAAV